MQDRQDCLSWENIQNWVHGTSGSGKLVRAKYPFVYCLAIFRLLSPNFIRSRFQYQVFPMLFTVVHFVSIFTMRFKLFNPV